MRTSRPLGIYRPDLPVYPECAVVTVVGASVEALQLQQVWSEVVEPEDLRELGAEPPPAGPIPVVMAGMREADAWLEEDELSF